MQLNQKYSGKALSSIADMQAVCRSVWKRARGSKRRLQLDRSRWSRAMPLCRGRSKGKQQRLQAMLILPSSSVLHSLKSQNWRTACTSCESCRGAPTPSKYGHAGYTESNKSNLELKSSIPSAARPLEIKLPLTTLTAILPRAHKSYVLRELPLTSLAEQILLHSFAGVLQHCCYLREETLFSS